jgi:thymidylate kinase
MIIVEGGDNCGKTTLIRQLIELDPKLRLLHRERFNPNKGETIGQSYLDALRPPADGSRVAHSYSIADRFFASECVYGNLFRGGCRMSAWEHFIIKSLLLSYGTFVIHCDPPDASVQLTWKDRDQLYNDQGNMWITDYYRSHIKDIFHPIPVVRYDWTATYAALHREQLVDRHKQMMRKFWDLLQWNVETCRSAIYGG